MKKRILIAVFSLYLFLSFPPMGSAQDVPAQREGVEMADRFREEGKIYVVLAIVGVTLAGLFIYTIGIDRKISRLEKEAKKSGQLRNH